MARSGKVVEIKDARECQKSVKREDRLSGRGRGGRRQLIISIERWHAVCPDCGSDKARYYMINDIINRIRRAAMAKNLDGVLGYWRFRDASNARTEGFNNKIRWLVRQAYGYRDHRYFRLKIFDLPNLRQRDDDS